MRITVLSVLAAVAATGTCLAQPAASLDAAVLASTCATCHGTQGHPAPQSTLPPLAGMPRGEMVEQLKAFQSGARPATVMHQIARGFTDAQLDTIAAWFAAQDR